MSLCRDCRHWDRTYKAESPEHSEWGDCLLAREDAGESAVPETLAVAWDAERNHAGLLTAPTFGCVQFEPKREGAA